MNAFFPSCLSLSSPSSLSSFSSCLRVLVKPSEGSKRSVQKIGCKKWCPNGFASQTGIEESADERQSVRLALPRRGQMAEETLNLLKDCQLPVRKSNPRQYYAELPALPELEVLFQRESDVVRSIKNDDADLGIVGYDTVREYGQDDDNLVVAHDALGIGERRICLAVPIHGFYQTITSMSELAAMEKWSKDRPLRIVTSYTSLGRELIEKNRFKHVKLLTADGSVQAAPAVGGSGVLISPLTYIFDEEAPQWKQLQKIIELSST